MEGVLCGADRCDMFLVAVGVVASSFIHDESSFNELSDRLSS